MDDETCWICVVLKYGLACTVGFVLGVAWMSFGG
mgnify:CR=1 FL=1